MRNTTGKEFVDFSFVRETQLIHPVMDVWVEIWQDETLANVRDNDPELYKKIMDNEPVNAQDCPLSCVWESNIPNEHDELLQYIIVECISLYSQQLVEFCKYLSEDSIIIFRLCGKRNDEVSVSCDKYFSDETMIKFIDKIDEEYRKMRENS